MNPQENYQVLDLYDLKISFAYMASIEVLEHISDQDIPGFLAGVKAKLNPGGKFVVTVPGDVRPVNRKHYRHYSEAELREQLEDAGLSDLHSEEFYYEGTLTSFITRLLSNSFFTVNHIGLKKALLKILVIQVRKKTKA
jgi:cyclopropane fatty-acyl-phospholipid synthase-like methyltransferase